MVPGSSNYIGNNDRFQLFAQVTEKINLTNVIKISLIFSIQDDCARIFSSCLWLIMLHGY